mgnify:CR=1 FL=1
MNSKVLPINRYLPILDNAIKFSLLGVAAFSLFSISLTQICVVVGALCWIIKASATNSWDNVKSIRGPFNSGGISTMKYNLVIGNSANQDIAINSPILLNYVKP